MHQHSAGQVQRHRSTLLRGGIKEQVGYPPYADNRLSLFLNIFEKKKGCDTAKTIPKTPYNALYVFYPSTVSQKRGA